MKHLIDFISIVQRISRFPGGDRTIGAITRLIWAVVALMALTTLPGFALMLLK